MHVAVITTSMLTPFGEKHIACMREIVKGKKQPDDTLKIETILGSY